MMWSSGRSQTLSQFMGFALGGVDLRMLPTLLGVRLLRDPKVGRVAWWPSINGDPFSNSIAWRPAAICAGADGN